MRVKTITCPNCGHANNFLAEECTQCGINFSRYYEELEKAETLRRHIEEQEKAEALRHEQEEQKRHEADEQQRQQEEQVRIAAEKREGIEEEKRLEAERLREEQERADVLKRQQEALAKAEALQHQKEEEEERVRLAAEVRKREKEEKEHLATEARDSENEGAQEEKATANAAADSSNPAENTNAVEIEELETADIEEYAGAFDFIEYPAEEPSDADHVANIATLDASPYNYRKASSLEERLRIYEGRMLGLAYGDPAEIQNVKLLAVNSDHFQVFYPVSRNVVSFPYDVIMSITENAEGLSAVGPDISPVFPMVVELPRPFFHAV
jgi:hypothetical protein